MGLIFVGGGDPQKFFTNENFYVYSIIYIYIYISYEKDMSTMKVVRVSFGKSI